MAVANLSVHGVPKFLAGFLYGMTAENHLEEITSCYKGGDLMYEELSFALNKVTSDGWDNITQGALELAIVALQIPQELNTCENMDEDLAAFEEWLTIFKDPSQLVKTVTKHLALHRKQIMGDVATVKAEWAAEQFWFAGITAADLATVAIGPIYPVYPSANEAYGLDAMAIPDFVAGLVYGFTGDNQLPELEECFHGT